MGGWERDDGRGPLCAVRRVLERALSHVFSVRLVWPSFMGGHFEILPTTRNFQLTAGLPLSDQRPSHLLPNQCLPVANNVEKEVTEASNTDTLQSTLQSLSLSDPVVESENLSLRTSKNRR